MIGQEIGYFVGARPFDFVADDGKRLVGANVFIGHKSTDVGVCGLRPEIYSCTPEVSGILQDLKPFNEYLFDIELRVGWKKGKIIGVNKA